MKRPSENTQLLRNWHNWSCILLFFRTTRTWEFNSTSPIRSMTFNMVLWGGPLYLLKLFDFVFNFITGWTIIGSYIGGFRLKFVSLSRVINHMTVCKFECSHWWKIYSKKSYTRFALQSECCNFNQWEHSNYNRSCDL